VEGTRSDFLYIFSFGSGWRSGVRIMLSLLCQWRKHPILAGYKAGRAPEFVADLKHSFVLSCMSVFESL
jgi:hypothetical protein